MSGGGDETPVEQEYHLKEKREQNTMDSKYPVPKFSAEHLRKTFDDPASIQSVTRTGPFDFRPVCPLPHV